MVCAEVEEAIGAAEALTPAAREALRSHLADCDACRDLADLYGYEAGEFPRRELPIVSEASYLRHRVLGRGGMGTTYAAWDVRLERPVAIKEPHFETGSTSKDELVRRFAREAKLTARLQHPAIVTIYEAGYFERNTEARPFYTMEPVDGHPLDIEIATRRSLEERLKLLPHLTTIANAVAYAHEHGVVHRDIKPPNILIGRYGEAVLIDWGLAKEVDEADAALGDTSAGLLTRVGAGTPNYMPPEQAMGMPATPQFDVYALGATLYQLICGVEPYHDIPHDRVREQLFATAPRSCGELEPRAPRDLVAIVEKAMAREPHRRFENADGLARELSRYQAGQLVESYRHSKLELLRRWFRRHRTIVTVSAVATMAIAVIAVWSFARILAARSSALEAEQRAEASERDTQHVLTQTQEQHGRTALATGRARDFLSSAESFVTALPKDPRLATKISTAQALRLASSAPKTFLIQYGGSITHLVALRGEELAMVVSGTNLVASDLDGEHRRTRTFRGDKLAIAAPPSGDMIAVVTDTGDAFVVSDGDFSMMVPLAHVADASFSAVSVSPDARWIAGCDPGGKVVLWSRTDGRVVETLRTQRAVIAIAVNNDGTVFWGEDGSESVMMQRLNAPATRRPLLLGDSPDMVAAVHLDHHGTRIAGADAGGIRIWDPSGAQPPTLRFATMRGAASNQAIDFAFSPDDSIVAGLHDGAVAFWRSDRDELIEIFTEDLSNATSIAYTAKGVIAVADSRGFLRVWRAAPQSTVLARYEPRLSENWLIAVHLKPDIAVVGNAKTGTTRVIWLDRSRSAYVLSTPGLASVALSGDGCTAAILSKTPRPTVSRYELCNGDPSPLLPYDVPADFNLSNVIIELVYGQVRLYGNPGWIDISVEKVLHPWAQGARKTAILTSAGKKFGVVWDGDVRGIFDTDGRHLANCDEVCAKANSYIALPEQRGMLLYSRDRLLRLDFASGKTTYLMQLPSEYRVSSAVSADATTLVVGDGEGVLRFIDLDAKEQMFEVVSSGDSIDKVVVDADSASVLSIADDGTVRRLDFTLPADPGATLAKLRSASIDGELTP